MVLESQNSSFVPPHSGYPLTFSHLPLFCITWLWQLMSPSLFPSLAPALACVSALKGRGGGRGGGSAVSAGSVMREQPECLWSLSEQSLDAAAPISFDPEGIVYRLGTGIAPSPADLDGHTHTHTHTDTHRHESETSYTYTDLGKLAHGTYCRSAHVRKSIVSSVCFHLHLWGFPFRCLLKDRTYLKWQPLYQSGSSCWRDDLKLCLCWSESST